MRRLPPLLLQMLPVMLAMLAAGCGTTGTTPAGAETSAAPAAPSQATPAPAPDPPAPAPPTPPPAPAAPAPPPVAPPQRVAVQHILISVGGKLPGKPVRTPDEARTLAASLLERARGGQDFDALVREFTDDRAPGIYMLANHGVTPAARDEYPRRGMVSCFGDVAFALAVGELGLCDYDERSSPWGFHIIKRIR